MCIVCHTYVCFTQITALHYPNNSVHVQQLEVEVEVDMKKCSRENVELRLADVLEPTFVYISPL